MDVETGPAGVAVLLALALLIAAAFGLLGQGRDVQPGVLPRRGLRSLIITDWDGEALALGFGFAIAIAAAGLLGRRRRCART
jgi:hypothetical protein